MKVKLTYFKQSGKYYSDGSFDTDKASWPEIFDEVKRLIDQKTLPGLVRGHSDFIVLMDVPDHPHNHPALLNIQADVTEARILSVTEVKWEYKVVPWPDGAKYPDEIKRMLDHVGGEGWRLCSSEYGSAIFVREKR